MTDPAYHELKSHREKARRDLQRLDQDMQINDEKKKYHRAVNRDVSELEKLQLRIKTLNPKSNTVQREERSLHKVSSEPQHDEA